MSAWADDDVEVLFKTLFDMNLLSRIADFFEGGGDDGEEEETDDEP